MSNDLNDDEVPDLYEEGDGDDRVRVVNLDAIDAWVRSGSTTLPRHDLDAIIAMARRGALREESARAEVDYWRERADEWERRFRALLDRYNAKFRSSLVGPSSADESYRQYQRENEAPTVYSAEPEEAEK